ncbi:uncharacterized protein LOC134272258 [Saccostrea cucullata]|uniref:uncharacterized protein LOC134272258 n=1 Tax=Saccostrea cuccullata TaxID=36930 RepID=UPI002ED08577
MTLPRHTVTLIVTRLCSSVQSHNKIGTSVEDRIFTNIKKKELVTGPDGNWVAPLPFRQPRQPLPNNYELSLRRARAPDASLKKNPVKRDHFTTFMLKLFDNDHAEEAPQLQRKQKRWYLPLFGVYYPQKPHQIRGVFDSSAKYEDWFKFSITTEDKPLSRRGVLSTVNSIFDPLGFLSHVIINGKLILREVVTETVDWDEPLSDYLMSRWIEWSSSLKALEDLCIPHVTVLYLSKAVRKELWTFCDASEKAVAAVSYVNVLYPDGSSKTGFVLRKSKAAPVSGHSIPRLEHYAAVFAVEISQTVTKYFDVVFDSVKYFSDSRFILGYVNNDKRRFFIYVSNKMERIRSFSNPDQWHFLPTHLNPANEGTRGVSPGDVATSTWLNGPVDVHLSDQDDQTITFPLVEPQVDKEIRPTCLKTECRPLLGTSRLERFSDWDRLVKSLSLLKRFIVYRNEDKSLILPKSLSYYQRAEHFLFKTVQQEVYAEEIDCLRSSQPLPKNSSILTLIRPIHR